MIDKFTKENSLELKKFIRKNKIRRAMVKLKFVVILNRVV